MANDESGSASRRFKEVIMRSLIVVAALLVATALVRAQTASPAFEVASVKPNKSGTTQANIGTPPNGVTIVNLPLRGIIQLFFQINQPSKVIGIPDWTATERYDISTRTSKPAT